MLHLCLHEHKNSTEITVCQLYYCQRKAALADQLAAAVLKRYADPEAVVPEIYTLAIQIKKAR